MRLPQSLKIPSRSDKDSLAEVHRFDSYFPAPVRKLPTSYDTSFALTAVGGGFGYRGLEAHLDTRTIQADSPSTPNSQPPRETARTKCGWAQGSCLGATREIVISWI